MRIQLLAVAAAIGIVTSTEAPAQSIGTMLGDDVRNVGKDIGSILVSPLDASGRDWALAAGAIGLFGVSMLADQSVSDWALDNANSGLLRRLEPVRSGGAFFAGTSVAPAGAALYVVGIAIKNQDLRDAVMGCLSSWGAVAIARRGTAFAFGRARPDTMPGDPQHWKLGGGYGNWQMRSFPAGHFANVTSCATFLNERFELGIAGPVAYAVAGAVGVGRMADGAHWFSDTVLGGILGYAVGREVAKRSRARRSGAGGNAGDADGGMSFYLVPGAHGALTAGVRRTF